MTPETEFTVFGKQVGLQLEQLPLTALKLQIAIQQLLSNARIASINDQSSLTSEVPNKNTYIALPSQKKEKVYCEPQTFNHRMSQPQSQATPKEEEASTLKLFYNKWSS